MSFLFLHLGSCISALLSIGIETGFIAALANSNQIQTYKDINLFLWISILLVLALAIGWRNRCLFCRRSRYKLNTGKTKQIFEKFSIIKRYFNNE